MFPFFLDESRGRNQRHGGRWRMTCPQCESVPDSKPYPAIQYKVEKLHHLLASTGYCSFFFIQFAEFIYICHSPYRLWQVPWQLWTVFDSVTYLIKIGSSLSLFLCSAHSDPEDLSYRLAIYILSIKHLGLASQRPQFCPSSWSYSHLKSEPTAYATAVAYYFQMEYEDWFI